MSRQLLGMTLARWAKCHWANIISHSWPNEDANIMPTLAQHLFAIWEFCEVNHAVLWLDRQADKVNLYTPSKLCLKEKVSPTDNSAQTKTYVKTVQPPNLSLQRIIYLHVFKFTNKELLSTCCMENIPTIIQRRRWRWIGSHILHKGQDSMTKTALFWTPEGNAAEGTQNYLVLQSGDRLVRYEG